MKKLLLLVLIVFSFANLANSQTSKDTVLLQLEISETSTEVHAKLIGYNLYDINAFQIFSIHFNPNAIDSAKVKMQPATVLVKETNYIYKVEIDRINILWIEKNLTTLNYRSLVIADIILPKKANLPSNIAFNLGSGNTYIFLSGISTTKEKPHKLLPNINTSASIKGKIVADKDGDCQLDSTDIALKNIGVKVVAPNDEPYYGISDSNGNYEIYVLDHSKTYTVSPVINNNIWKNCSNDIVLTSILPTNNTVNFTLKAPIVCPFPNVSVSNNRLRRCVNNTFDVYFSNSGNISMNNAYGIVTLDKWFKFIKASQPYTLLDNNQIRFELGNIDINETKKITIEVKVNCDSTVVGQTHCLKAALYPISSCVPTALTPKITATCENNKVIFETENPHNVKISDFTFYYLKNNVIQKQLFVNEILPLSKRIDTIPASGETWNLIITQLGKKVATAFVEACGRDDNGQFSIGYVDDILQLNPAVNAYEWCGINTDSYDPNDKNGFPQGVGINHFIEPNTPLEYRIRFQNTGNDVAYNVVVEDEIDMTSLDISSLRVLEASHNYAIKIKDRNRLVFEFKDINLLDSVNNEPLSHGYIKFRINQKQDLFIGKVIKNKAAIYFDFNKPVITNETFHTIGRNFLPTSVRSSYTLPNVEIAIQPHPIVQQSTLVIKGLEDTATPIVLELFNMLGQKTAQLESTTSSFIIEGKNLQAGIYTFRILQKSQLIGTGKLIVE